MVVAYRLHWLTYQIAKRMIKVNYASLPNLLADEMLVPECLQYDATVENLYHEVSRQLEQPNPQLLEEFEIIHRSIQLDSSVRAADAIDVLIKKSRVAGEGQ